MFALIGLILVAASVVGGYMVTGGHLDVLWQPGEFVIIGGAAFGAFLASNSKGTIIGVTKSFPLVFRGPRYHEKHYLELLCLLFTFFKIAKMKGDMALEPHVEKPEESSVFKNYPTITKNHEAMDFLCGYMRLLTLGSKNANEIETVMDSEIEGLEHELNTVSSSVQNMADGMPALGIVAAVLGVIHTMGAISEPPEILGHLIGAALVGTFFGILCCYGFVGPIASAIAAATRPDVEYMRVIKAALIGHMQGYAPQISVEFARKSIAPEDRPSFTKVDVACNNVSVPQ